MELQPARLAEQKHGRAALSPLLRTENLSPPPPRGNLSVDPWPHSCAFTVRIFLGKACRSSLLPAPRPSLLGL